MREITGALAVFVVVFAVACGPASTPTNVSSPSTIADSNAVYWRIATQGTGDTALSFVDANAITETGDVREATSIIYMALPPDLTRFAVRLDARAGFECASRLVRPISTGITAREMPTQTNQESGNWTPLEEAPQMEPLFAFVCASNTRGADSRFARIEAPNGLDILADAHFARTAQAGDAAVTTTPTP